MSAADSTSSPSPSIASTDAAPTAASVELLIPSHTRSWPQEKRSIYAPYCQQHEMEVITPLVDTNQPITLSSNADSSALQAGMSATSTFLATPPPVNTLEARGRIIQNGDQSICDFGRGKAWINFDGAPNKAIRIGKQDAKVDNLVGQPYGQVWELEKGKLTRTNRKRGLGTALLDPTMTTTRDNSQLFDRNESQKLTQSQIEALKASGEATPQELIDMLVENSTTFASKTEFSQEKYIKKKKQKHCSEVTVLPASLARVLETFWEKDPKKARGMRPDTVAMLLTAANIQAGTNSLIVESCGGQIIGSVMYRQQGLGYTIHAFENNQKRTEGVKRFNFPDNIHDSLLHVPLDKLLLKAVAVNPSANAAKLEDVDVKNESSSSSSDATVGDLKADEILANQVDVIILATRYEPFALLQTLWPYLKPAGRFVIYDEVIESLSHCHAKLSQGGIGKEVAMNLVLSETFFRNLQVLPNRTHPFVNMSASGGYLLSGMKTRAK